MTKEVRKLGYAFSQVRPRGDRDPANHTVSIVFVVEEGPRVYVERINVRGNTATRDYVIRREFDIGEGDAYNKVLIDKAERRLNSLGFFKKVKITNEPGSAADRVIINVDVEEQSTGSFSVSGGYSTTQGFIAEVSVTQSNFLGRGDYIAPRRLRRPVHQGHRAQLYRALLPRQPPCGGLRSLLQDVETPPTTPIIRTGSPAAPFASAFR